jgi:hypothetical protein
MQQFTAFQTTGAHGAIQYVACIMYYWKKNSSWHVSCTSRHPVPQLTKSFPQVRGTSGCGKTTLMELLHSHILKQSPLAFVNSRSTWPGPKEAERSDEALIKRLKDVDPLFPRRNGLAFLLFDEGQNTYEDDILWNIFFKGVSDGRYNRYRVILFCRYGSPSSRPVLYHIGTRLVLRDAARISLWPRKGSIGILLKRSEFDEVVSRFKRPLNLHPDLLDLIFDWTVGHAGAVIEMLCVISYQVSPPSENRVGLSYSCLLTLFPREHQKHDVGCSSQWKPFMLKTLLITSYGHSAVELLNAAFLRLRSSGISQTWWHCLETCSNMARLTETKMKMQPFASAIAVGGSMPTWLQMMQLRVTHFHLPSILCVFPGDLNLRTTCPI